MKKVKIVLVSLLMVINSHLWAQSSTYLKFDGVDDRITVPNNSAYNLSTGDFSVELSIKVYELPYGLQFQGIISNYSFLTNKGFALYLFDGRLNVLMGLVNIQVSQLDLRDNQCHHIAVTRAGNILTFYLDGLNAYSANTSVEDINTNENLGIGWGTDFESFNGLLKEVRIWSSARSVFDITNNINSILIGAANASLIGYWRCESANQSVVDYSLTANNGTLGYSVSSDLADPIAIIDNCSLCLPPSNPSAIQGQSSGLCNAASKTYSIPAVSNATSYVWAVPTGASIINGSGTNTVSVKFTPSFSSGNISVVALNSCGQSGSQTLLLNAKAAVPSAINGSTNVCARQKNLTYSIAPVLGATSYTWTVPAGVTINSGQGTSTLKVRWSNSSGFLSVKSNNGCGSSFASNLFVNVVGCREAVDSENDEVKQSVNFYPSPVVNKLTLQFNSNSEETALINIVDIHGKSIMQFNAFVKIGLNNLERDVSKLERGVYLLQIISNHINMQNKILKM